MFNKEFDLMFDIILNDSIKNVPWFNLIFSLGEEYKLKVDYIIISSYTYSLKFTLLQDNRIVVQIFDKSGLFGRLCQLDLLDIFCDEVIKWRLKDKDDE